MLGIAGTVGSAVNKVGNVVYSMLGNASRDGNDGITDGIAGTESVKDARL